MASHRHVRAISNLLLPLQNKSKTRSHNFFFFFLKPPRHCDSAGSVDLFSGEMKKREKGAGANNGRSIGGDHASEQVMAVLASNRNDLPIFSPWNNKSPH